MPYQRVHAVREIGREPQTSANAHRNLRAHPVVLVEPDTVFKRLGRGFSYVVQQRPQRESRRRRLHQVQQHHRMGKDIPLGMVFGRLFASFHRGYFGQHLLQESRFIQQAKRLARARLRQHAQQFVPNPFGARPSNSRREPLHGLEGLRLDCEIKLRREANTTHQAQGILGEARVRVAHGPDQAPF
jgi:hypothetical protein